MAATEPHLIRSVSTYSLQGYTSEDANHQLPTNAVTTSKDRPALISSGVPDRNTCSLELYRVQQRAVSSLQMQI